MVSGVQGADQHEEAVFRRPPVRPGKTPLRGSWACLLPRGGLPLVGRHSRHLQLAIPCGQTDRGGGPGMSGARGAQVGAAVGGDRSVGTFWHMGYGVVLKTLDAKIDELARLKEPVKRLCAGGELMLGLYTFILELEGRCHSLRGAIELETMME